MLTEDEQQAAIHAIAEAAFDPREWTHALSWIAKAGEGWCAQVIGISPHGVQFHAAHGVTPEMTDEFDRRGGTNPAINPRARVLSQDVYAVCRDHDLAAPEELRRSEFVNDFLYRTGGHNILGVHLPSVGDTAACLIVSRNRRRLDRELHEGQFGLLLRTTHDALRLSAAIDGRGVELVRNALSGLALTAFIVDNSRRVVGLTPRAEALAREGNLLRLTRTGIEAADLQADTAFQTALAMSCAKPNSARHPVATKLNLRSLSGSTECVEIAPLPPQDFSLRFGPVAVVVVKAKPKNSGTDFLRKRFALSVAETQIVEGLLAGNSLAEIAEKRAVSPGTVRSQLKSIFAKTEVRRQSELVALLYREMFQRR
jgi:DNA-binding CsgD family transcriptional regulator